VRPNAAIQPPAGWRDACHRKRRDRRVGRLQRVVMRHSSNQTGNGPTPNQIP
jgi:hypothetical protein